MIQWLYVIIKYDYIGLWINDVLLIQSHLISRPSPTSWPSRASPWSLPPRGGPPRYLPSLQRLTACWGTAGPMGPWCGALKGKGSWRSPGALGCNLCWWLLQGILPWLYMIILYTNWGWSQWDGKSYCQHVFLGFDVGYVLETSTWDRDALPSPMRSMNDMTVRDFLSGHPAAMW